MSRKGNRVKSLIALIAIFGGISMPVIAGADLPPAVNTAPESSAAGMSWHFEDVPAGQVPAGWRVEATNQKGSLPVWEVVKDSSAPSPDHALAMARPGRGSGGMFSFFGGTFNLCWTDKVSFLDGTVKTGFRAVKGREDQGGGVMWRVLDRDNYYVARFNPLEDNFRLYRVLNGHRKMLASATIRLPAGWHTLGITQKGSHMAGYIDGRKLLETSDGTFPSAGGAGLWTKADAVTLFDDFSVIAQ